MAESAMFATFAAAGHFEGKVKFLEVDCIDGGKKAEAFCGKHGVRGSVSALACTGVYTYLATACPELNLATPACAECVAVCGQVRTLCAHTRCSYLLQGLWNR